MGVVLGLSFKVGGAVANGVVGRDGRRAGGASQSLDARQASMGVSTVHGQGRLGFRV